jgi:quercetin dioxygenase-like cupin family protein
MQIINLDALVVRNITQFDSAKLSAAPLAKSSDRAQIIVMRIEAGGQIGFHQAPVPQLFVVAQGSGWVCDESQARIPIAAGQAVLWNAGEWHAAGAAQDLVALVIESPSLQLFSNA